MKPRPVTLRKNFKIGAVVQPHSRPLARPSKSESFRRMHLLQILEAFDPLRGPLDRFVHLYFRQHRALGSKDRAQIAQDAYRAVRFRELLDRFCRSSATWKERLTLLDTHELSDLQKRCQADLAASQSIPKPLFDLLAGSFDESTLREQCRLINTPAPISLRVNTLKGSREQLLLQLPTALAARCSSRAPHGVLLKRREALFTLECFRTGWFEVQDEGSQLIAEQVGASRGDWVVDFCAGSGGKSLAIAPKLEGTGQIFLGDVRPKALLEAKARLKRAGIQNAQTLCVDHPMWKQLANRADWVLADVPCTGSGTLRRNPDMKGKIDAETLRRLVALQREIFQRASKLVKPGGRLCYATCSLLRAENQEQVEFFTSQSDFAVCHPPFQTRIVENGPDGFFAAVLQKTISCST